MNGEIPSVPITTLAGISSLTDLLPEMPLPSPLPQTMSNKSLLFHPRVAEEAHILLSLRDDTLVPQLAQSLNQSAAVNIELKDHYTSSETSNVDQQNVPELLKAILFCDPEVFNGFHCVNKSQQWNLENSTQLPPKIISPIVNHDGVTCSSFVASLNDKVHYNKRITKPEVNCGRNEKYIIPSSIDGENVIPTPPLSGSSPEQANVPAPLVQVCDPTLVPSIPSQDSQTVICSLENNTNISLECGVGNETVRNNGKQEEKSVKNSLPLTSPSSFQPTPPEDHKTEIQDLRNSLPSPCSKVTDCRDVPCPIKNELFYTSMAVGWSEGSPPGAAFGV